MKNYFLLLLVVLAMNANGAVIVDSLGAMNTRDNVYRRAAQAFYTTYQSWIITDVAIIGIGISPDIEISIFSSDYTKPLSKIATLYRGSAEDAGFGRLTTSRTPTNFTFSSVELAPQTHYWIVVENYEYYSGYTSLTWGSTFSNSNYGDGYDTMARDSLSETSWGSYQSNPYVMEITAVPEPNHLMMLGVGALIVLRRSRSKPKSATVPNNRH